MALPEQAEVGGENVAIVRVCGNVFSRYVSGTICSSNDGEYELCCEACSLLKINVSREVTSCSIVNKNRCSSGRLETQAAVASETSVLL